MFLMSLGHIIKTNLYICISGTKRQCLDSLYLFGPAFKPFKPVLHFKSWLEKFSSEL